MSYERIQTTGIRLKLCGCWLRSSSAKHWMVTWLSNTLFLKTGIEQIDPAVPSVVCPGGRQRPAASRDCSSRRAFSSRHRPIGPPDRRTRSAGSLSPGTPGRSPHRSSAGEILGGVPFNLPFVHLRADYRLSKPPKKTHYVLRSRSAKRLRSSRTTTTGRKSGRARRRLAIANQPNTSRRPPRDGLALVKILHAL